MTDRRTSPGKRSAWLPAPRQAPLAVPPLGSQPACLSHLLFRPNRLQGLGKSICQQPGLLHRPDPFLGTPMAQGLLLPREGSFALPGWQRPRALQAPAKRSLSPCRLPWLLRWQEGRLLPSLGLRLSLSFHPNSRKQSPSLLVPAQEALFLQVLWEMLPLGRERGLLQANLPPQPPLPTPVTCAAQEPPPLPTSLMDKLQICMNS